MIKEEKNYLSKEYFRKIARRGTTDKTVFIIYRLMRIIIDFNFIYEAGG